MPVQELDLRAHMLRETLWNIKAAPDDKSIHQLREEAIIRMLEEVIEEARMRALSEEIYAIGQNPEQAIRALAHVKGWSEVTRIEDLKGGDERYTWGRRFYADGTSMKAAGWDVPGGVVLTWWK
jgi:hypothetical protein